jgi:hypothetical protein
MPGMTYIAGVDLGRVNDSTVITIGRHEFADDGDRLDVVYIKEIHPSEDRTYPEQYEIIINTLREWRVQTCVVDHTGPGIPAFESLVAVGSSRNLPTNFVPFSFQSNTKYPQFLRLRSMMQNRPLPRVRYPKLGYVKLENHPCYNAFLKADIQFRDIVQKRTNSSNDGTKYKVEPSKQKAHDDFVASAICLIQTLTDAFTNSVPIVAVNTRREDQNVIDKARNGIGIGSGGVGRRSKYSNTWKKYNIWRQF